MFVKLVDSMEGLNLIKRVLFVILLLFVLVSTPVYAEGIFVNNEVIDAPSINEEGVTLDLAYGQSWSIYNFLVDKYGKEKIRNIFYTEGKASDILRSITGRNMNELETDWKKYIAEEYKHR